MGNTLSNPPPVSICIPTYNGAKWLRECLDSATAQSYADVEILVVDDASTDDTAEVARSVGDERVRVVVSERNRGLVGNWNECLRLARGEFIKFLFQDDTLHPLCVEKMLGMMLAQPLAGLVFAPRNVIVEPDVTAEQARRWLDYAETLHRRFDLSPGVNDGRALFLQHLRKKFLACCVGEPTTVLLRRQCFERLGLFNPRLHQVCDIEMWLRVMYFYDVGFVDEKLSSSGCTPARPRQRTTRADATCSTSCGSWRGFWATKRYAATTPRS